MCPIPSQRSTFDMHRTHVHLHPPMLPPRCHTNSRCRFNTFGSPRLLPSRLRNANDVPHNVGPTGSMRPPTGAHGTLLSSSFHVHLAEFFFLSSSSFALGLCRTMTSCAHLATRPVTPRHLDMQVAATSHHHGAQFRQPTPTPLPPRKPAMQPHASLATT